MWSHIDEQSWRGKDRRPFLGSINCVLKGNTVAQMQESWKGARKVDSKPPSPTDSSSNRSSKWPLPSSLKQSEVDLEPASMLLPSGRTTSQACFQGLWLQDKTSKFVFEDTLGTIWQVLPFSTMNNPWDWSCPSFPHSSVPVRTPFNRLLGFPFLYERVCAPRNDSIQMKRTAEVLGKSDDETWTTSQPGWQKR